MLQKSSMLRTLEIFFREPTHEHYLMDISRRIKLAHTSVKNNLTMLVKLNLISELIDKKGGRKFPVYKSNNQNRAFIKYKQVYNLNSILESGIIEFIEEKLTPKSLILFGSYRRGEDDEASDIDLFVECKKKEIEIIKYQQKLGRKVELHFSENFSLLPKELKNNIANGIVLIGFLEVFK